VLTVIGAAWGLGGAERLAAELTVRLDPDRFERAFCVTRPMWGYEVEDRMRTAGVRTLTLERGSRADLLAWRPLISLLRQERPDILHCHLFGSYVSGTPLGRLTGVPVVIAHRHTGSPDAFRLHQLLDRQLIARNVHAFLVVSQQARRLMIEDERIDPTIVRVLPNGIPPLPEPTSDVRKELEIPADAPVVGVVGVLRPEKALDVLIRAFAQAARDVPGLRLIIVGGGPEEIRLRALVAELGLDGMVNFAGPRVNVADFLAIFDVGLLSSDYEGTPLSVIEYMAAGKPVVATRVGGVPDLVEHGVHGFLVRRRDPEGLARAVVRLLRDPPLRLGMGEAGRMRQQREFTIDATLRHLELLYEELFRASRRGRRERSRPVRKPSDVGPTQVSSI
jgi:glycosyltransferase involved in cell wall biosynthesis